MSEATDINDRNEIVGVSWASTGGINERGEIAAQANVVSNGVVTSEAHAVLLVPCNECNQGTSSAAPKLIIPDEVQKQMRERVRIARLQLPSRSE